MLFFQNAKKILSSALMMDDLYSNTDLKYVYNDIEKSFPQLFIFIFSD